MVGKALSSWEKSPRIVSGISNHGDGVKGRRGLGSDPVSPGGCSHPLSACVAPQVRPAARPDAVGALHAGVRPERGLLRQRHRLQHPALLRGLLLGGPRPRPLRAP